jgi:Na+-translocating ferredoxin:NAD+ oxidoreductase RNF subunit RnfB
LLIIGEHYFAVKLDDDVDKIKSMLPGINCGACGHVNCEGFAKALKNKKVDDAGACKVMSNEQINKVNEFINKEKSLPN